MMDDLQGRGAGGKPAHRRIATGLWGMLREGATPLVWLLALSLLALFGFLAEDVIDGDFRELDERILLALRHAADSREPLGPLWLQEAARDLTSLGSFAFLFLLTLAAFFYLLIVRQHASALLVLVSIAGGTLLNMGLKMGFDRPRPDLVPHGAPTFTASFPSGHAMMAAVTFLTLGALIARVQPRRRLRIFVVGLAIVLTLIVGITRVYLGVHWPSDVVAGWTVGAAWALICWLAMARLQPGRRATP